MNAQVLSKSLKNVTDPPSKLKMSNWCGCLAPQAYYNTYEYEMIKELNLNKFEVSATGLLGHRACYGACNTQEAPIPSDYSKDCPKCIQTIINNIGKLDKSKLQQYQSGACEGSIIEKKGGDVKPTGGDVKPTGGDVKPTGGDVKPTGGDVNVNNWKYLLIMLIVLVIIFGFMICIVVYTKKPIQPFMMSMFKGFKF
jgi:hypothetical protein